MILADTSVWVRHIRNEVPILATLLAQRQVITHTFVIGELVCGNLPDRPKFISRLNLLQQAAIVENAAVFQLIEAEGLAGRGIGWIDAHLLAASATRGHLLWTFDKSLAEVADELDLLASF